MTELIEASQLARVVDGDQFPANSRVEWNDQHGELLHDLFDRADREGAKVEVLFGRLTPDLLIDVVFGYRCVVPQSPKVTASGDLTVGAALPMPIDPVDYDAARGLSLVSPSMAEMIDDLRWATLSMHRPNTPDLPWDASDRQPSAVKKNGQGDLRLSVQGTPNISEVFRFSDDPDVRRRYFEPLSASDVTQRHRFGWGLMPPRLLITGDTGTGKSLVARLAHAVVHGRSSAIRPLVHLNAGEIGGQNFSHLMYGSAKEQWTGIGARVGSLAQAAFGTAFLDEIGDLAWDAQTALLTYLDDGVVRPTGMASFFGYTHVFAATNRPLSNMIRNRRFRHDLLARFGQRVHIPSLAQRSRQEIWQLIDFVAQHPIANYDRSVSTISSAAMQALLRHDFADGNFRELEFIMYEALGRARRASGTRLELEHLDIPEQPIFRPEAERYVVRVAELPDWGQEILVADNDELVHLAEIYEVPILSSTTGRCVLHKGIRYLVDPAQTPK